PDAAVSIFHCKDELVMNQREFNGRDVVAHRQTRTVEGSHTKRSSSWSTVDDIEMNAPDIKDAFPSRNVVNDLPIRRPPRFVMPIVAFGNTRHGSTGARCHVNARFHRRVVFEGFKDDPLTVRRYMRLIELVIGIRNQFSCSISAFRTDGRNMN